LLAIIGSVRVSPKVFTLKIQEKGGFVMGHPVMAFSFLGHGFYSIMMVVAIRMFEKIPYHFFAYAWLCGISPDFDYVLHFLGIEQGLFSHRGFTHSIVIAPAAAAILAVIWFRALPWTSRRLRKAWLIGSCTYACHPILDMLNVASNGCAVLWPVNWVMEYVMLTGIGQALFETTGPDRFVFSFRFVEGVADGLISWWNPILVLHQKEVLISLIASSVLGLILYARRRSAERRANGAKKLPSARTAESFGSNG
jgi:membrane-bound metal-dependent hydrolase YbcI (DUF457 family)